MMITSSIEAAPRDVMTSPQEARAVPDMRPEEMRVLARESPFPWLAPYTGPRASARHLGHKHCRRSGISLTRALQLVLGDVGDHLVSLPKVCLLQGVRKTSKAKF
jgi:hypothetical protein